MLVAEQDLAELEESAAEIDRSGPMCHPSKHFTVEIVNNYVALQRRVNELQTYLLSSKFYSPDDYVNVRDVLSRLA